MQGWFLPTAKNPPVREIYRDAGLACVERTASGELWSIEATSGAIATPAWIRLIDQPAVA
jgi:hypothetical protein